LFKVTPVRAPKGQVLERLFARSAIIRNIKDGN